jgi:hypothetical protein
MRWASLTFWSNRPSTRWTSLMFSPIIHRRGRRAWAVVRILRCCRCTCGGWGGIAYGGGGCGRGEGVRACACTDVGLQPRAATGPRCVPRCVCAAQCRCVRSQTLVKHWSNTGQTLVKHWSNTAAQWQCARSQGGPADVGPAAAVY